MHLTCGPMLNHRLLAATVLITALTGCITIEENYSFKKNGSGTMSYVVDMSEMGALLESFGDGKKSKEEEDPMGNMDLSGHADGLKNLVGVSKVKVDKSKKWVQRISFAFKDIDALNRALAQLMPDSSGVAHEYFHWEDGTLVRTNNRHQFNLTSTIANTDTDEDEASEDGEEEEQFDMATLLSSMKYNYSFKFQENVGTVEAGTLVQEKPGSKEVRLSTDWGVISKDPKALDLRIALDR